MRDVILYLAVSLDGFLADSQGGVAWLGGESPDYSGDYGYSALISNVDTVLMGWNTYRQVTEELSPGQWPYQGLHTYVFTHRALPCRPGVRFTCENPAAVLAGLKRQPGKNIWICGGAQLIGQLMDQQLIDEYHLSVMPLLLGTGVPLFQGTRPAVPLHLVQSTVENGVVRSIYRRRIL